MLKEPQELSGARVGSTWSNSECFNSNDLNRVLELPGGIPSNVVIAEGK